jgi:ribosomal protein S18 acetylase RimI-like enzyme
MGRGAEDQLEIVRLRPALEGALAAFFVDLVATGEAGRFHPHPFTAEAARERALYDGLDVYCAAIAGRRVLAYGMLRGWDAGFEVPSLGIAVRAEAQGTGLGRLVMAYLHTEARRRGAARIRLKVYPDNVKAVELYRSLGYAFGPDLERGQMVGYKELSARTDAGSTRPATPRP